MNLKESLEHLTQQTGARCDYLDCVGSTNDLAHDPCYHAGSVIVAERQTASRGQRGNSWSSTEGLNLTFSLVLCPDFLPAEKQFYLSKVVALAVADTATHWGKRAQIKWPNDIYIDDYKTAGILIENDLSGNKLSRSIVGIGLNVNQTCFDNTLPNPTSLACAAGHPIDRTACFEYFYRQMCLWYGLLQQGRHELIDTEYLHRLYRLGTRHPFVDGRTKVPFYGTIRTVLPTGELEVKADNGTTTRYLFKEIEYVVSAKL